MAKYNHFQVIATAERTERVPKVPGAWYFGLPFVMDPDVTWADYFGGIEPRAFLVGRYPHVQEDGAGGSEAHPKAGMVYPLDLAPIQAVYTSGDFEADGAAAFAEAANFIGVAIEGTDYENDVNMTVALAGGIPLKYLQQDNTADPYVPDPEILALYDSMTLGASLGVPLLLPLRVFNGHIFWNTVQ